MAEGEESGDGGDSERAVQSMKSDTGASLVARLEALQAIVSIEPAHERVTRRSRPGWWHVVLACGHEVDLLLGVWPLPTGKKLKCWLCWKERD
jgi:hypothetical protein